MSNSINFDVLNNAAAMLFVTKGEQYQSQIIRLLCQYHGANTNESVLDVINTLLSIICEEYVSVSERDYNKALIVSATETMFELDVQPQVMSWLTFQYSSLINK